MQWKWRLLLNSIIFYFLENNKWRIKINWSLLIRCWYTIYKPVHGGQSALSLHNFSHWVFYGQIQADSVSVTSTGIKWNYFCVRSPSEWLHSSYGNLKIVVIWVVGVLAPCVVKGSSLCFCSWSPTLSMLIWGSQWLCRAELHGCSLCRYCLLSSSETSTAALKCWHTAAVKFFAGKHSRIWPRNLRLQEHFRLLEVKANSCLIWKLYEDSRN